ncbi:putative branched-chain-amino-acid aminotransferase TOXF [Cyphellophora attinorum]|uniref:Putative branched-chain-amino-acid aminotransferase TOXF n=1 Tax=Cyphellophora attinorum TaxID=1664694 RepID=A0A0N1HH59_9EURO|nr:putative branched-chain-amino-acid aminotransferase TOXF [Phialophora attinorum]KPI45747.1 putative branched-chain-amino-acid aminotransferase TOXF [Phialophora attinorum]
MAKFPPPPVSTIDWSNVGFKVREVNGHIECKFTHSGSAQWSAPQFITSPHLSIHGMAPGLNYGNALRMAHSAEYISAPPVPPELFTEAVNLAVALNAEYVPPHETGAAMYIRPLLFGSSAQLGLNPPDEYTFCVFVMPTGVYTDFDRAAPEGTGSAKIGGNYAPVLRHSEKARNAGFGITLHLDSKTRSEIDEFSTSGFLGVKVNGDKTTIVVPDSKNVIKSVTSESACQIARDVFGYKVERRRIPYDELKDFQEVMACGTAASLVPIKSITMKSTGDKFEYPVNEAGDPGKVCEELLRTLKGMQMGKVGDKFKWCHTVTEAPEGFGGEQNGKVMNGTTNGVDQLP